jgi:hypothetical protein
MGAGGRKAGDEEQEKGTHQHILSGAPTPNGASVV